ncbi:MAG TPA: hypothetical protein VNL98_10230 [Gemmatimonadales bacterium]|nr:hypothetical protein [Gemmatimonadales bacterium]
MRPLGTAILALALTGRPALSQAPLATDLWRVAAATLASPEALASGPAGSLWNPAAPAGRSSLRHQFAIETIHSPAEMGVAGVVGGLSRHQRGIGTVTLLYGRMGIEDLARTETSPEALPDGVPVYAQVTSLGYATGVSDRLTLGVAVRSLSARLASRREGRGALDFGGRLALRGGFALAAATRFLDPLFGSGRTSTSWSVALEWLTPPFELFGLPAGVNVRAGSTAGAGEQVRFLGLGLDAARLLQVDLGAANELAFGAAVWRARVAVSLVAGRYTVRFARDSGVHGFGGTYRFGLGVEAP